MAVPIPRRCGVIPTCGAALLGLAVAVSACRASFPLRSSLAARSRIGNVTREELQALLAPRAPAESTPALRRRVLEDHLATRALEIEGRARGHLGTAEGRRRLEEGRRRVLTEAVEARFVEAKVTVSDQAVEEFVASHQTELAGAEHLRLRHIFRRLSSHATAAEREQARADMEGWLAEIWQGADLGALARAHSDSQTASFDGQIVPVARGQLPPAIESVVWGLGVGEVSHVLPVSDGFHIFKLEERLPPQPLDPEAARRLVRRKLLYQTRLEARARLWSETIAASGATYRPDALADPDLVVFSLGSDRLTVRDLRERREALPFLEQRTRSLQDLLEARAWQELLLWKAQADALDREADVAKRLQDLERQTVIDMEYERRVAEWNRRVSDPTLAGFYRENPRLFTTPEQHHLRAVVVPLSSAAPAQEVFDRLDGVAREIRAGRRDFAEAARALSSDPSAERGGDLGWIELRDVGLWAGTRAYQNARRLLPGEVSQPLLVEVYNEAQLSHEPKAYLLLRVEEVAPRRLRPWEEVRAQAARVFAAANPQKARAQVYGEILRSIHAAFLE